jgi:hypothetical protein
MREAGAPDGREAGSARDRPGDGDGRGERWAGLLHDAAYYAARAVAEGRLSPEALWPRSPAQAGAPR